MYTYIYVHIYMILMLMMNCKPLINISLFLICTACGLAEDNSDTC